MGFLASIAVKIEPGCGRARDPALEIIELGDRLAV
jgi:hypothetical protein